MYDGKANHEHKTTQTTNKKNKNTKVTTVCGQSYIKHVSHTMCFMHTHLTVLLAIHVNIGWPG